MARVFSMFLRATGGGNIALIPGWRKLKLEQLNDGLVNCWAKGSASFRSWVRLFLLDRPAHLGPWHRDLVGKVEGEYCISFSKSLLIHAEGDHLLNARFRNLGGDKSRVLSPKAQCWRSYHSKLKAEWTALSDPSMVLTLSNPEKQLVQPHPYHLQSGHSNCLSHWNVAKNTELKWSQAVSQVYKAPQRINEEINTEMHVFSLEVCYFCEQEEKSSRLSKDFWTLTCIMSSSFTTFSSKVCRLKRLPVW